MAEMWAASDDIIITMWHLGGTRVDDVPANVAAWAARC